jgi:hypothetical protein
MRKADWAKIAYRLAMGIDYCNFKDEVHKRPDQANKHSAYLSVWSAMLRVQHEENSRELATQPYFNPWQTAWERELDYALTASTPRPRSRPRRLRACRRSNPNNEHRRRLGDSAMTKDARRFDDYGEGETKTIKTR